MAGKSRHPDDRRILECLAAGMTQVDAARTAGCSVSTIARRLDDPQFVAKIEKARTQMLDSAGGKLAAVVGKAVDCLEQLLESEVPSVRLAASKCIIEQALRLKDFVSFEARIVLLESRHK